MYLVASWVASMNGVDSDLNFSELRERGYWSFNGSIYGRMHKVGRGHARSLFTSLCPSIHSMPSCLADLSLDFPSFLNPYLSRFRLQVSPLPPLPTAGRRWSYVLADPGVTLTMVLSPLFRRLLLLPSKPWLPLPSQRCSSIQKDFWG